MKKAKIETKVYEETKTKSVVDDLGLAEDDISSIKSKLIGVEEETKVENFLYVQKASPYSIVLTESDGKPPVATLLCLCEDQNKELFILFHNYIIESDEDLEIIKENPLYTENQFITNTMTFSMLHRLKCYNTDLDMYTATSDDDDKAHLNNMLYTYGYIKGEDESLIKLYVPYSVANTILYMDNYIGECDNSDDAIDVLSNVMFMEGFADPAPTERIFVDGISSVPYIALKNKKESLYQIAFKIDNPHAKGETDKTITVSKSMVLEGRYRTNSSEDKLGVAEFRGKDRYFTVFDYECIIDEKYYTVLKVCNIDEDSTISNAILLYLDEDMMNSLEDMIITTYKK